jgi:hypothetical protein
MERQALLLKVVGEGAPVMTTSFDGKESTTGLGPLDLGLSPANICMKPARELGILNLAWMAP